MHGDPTIVSAEQLFARRCAEIRTGALSFNLNSLAEELRSHARGVDGFEQAARIVEAVSSGVDEMQTSPGERDDILASIGSALADRAFDE